MYCLGKSLVILATVFVVNCYATHHGDSGPDNKAPGLTASEGSYDAKSRSLLLKVVQSGEAAKALRLILSGAKINIQDAKGNE